MLPQLSAVEMPVPLSLEQFGHQVTEHFFPMSCEAQGEGSFRGTLQSRRIGQIGLAAVSSSALEVYRRRDHIGRVGEQVYMVKVQAQGRGLIRHRGREVCLQTGDFTICSSAEPYQLSFPGSYCHVVLAVPAQVMTDCVRDPDRFLGQRMDGRVGANGLFSQFVISLVARLDSLDGVLARRLEVNVLDLLATTLSHAPEGRRRDIANVGVRSEYLQRVKAFIQRHLDDECLGPEWIAARHDISTRYLHMLFQSEGVSVSRYIQQLRLEACRTALADSTYRRYSVAEIAYRFGFKDASHFSRVFKQHYRATPAKFRKACCQLGG